MALTLTALALMAGLAGAVTGELSFQGCFADTSADGCPVPAQKALADAGSVAVSPDNKSVYVTASFDDSISHFTRNRSNGNLSYQGCFADTAADGCTVPAGAALNATRTVAVSPDNESV